MAVTTLATAAIVAFDGLLDGIVPTANFSPPAGYPLTNLANRRLWDRTRTPDLTADRQLTWDLLTAREANVFAWVGTNATADVLGRLRAADDAGFTTNVIQSGAALAPAFDDSLGQSRAVYVAPWGRTLVYVHPTSFTKRYVRWHQSDTGNPDGYQEWGIPLLGLAWQPAIGMESWRAVPSLVGPKGSEVVLRGHEMTWELLTRDEAYDLQSMALSMLSTRRVLVLPEPLAPASFAHDALWCVLESSYVRDPVSGTAFAEKRYRVSLTFREVSR